jgi:hypothetical protein
VLRLLRRGFDFFIFSSLFIAGCALLMVYQSALLFSLYLPSALYGFVACGTLCSYNFHWALTPPQPEGPSGRTVWSIRHRRIHVLLSFVGGAGALLFALDLLPYWHLLLSTALFAFLYSAPKIPHPAARALQRIALGKTVYLAFAWTHVTALLPLLLHTWELSAAGIAFVVNRFFFLYGLCLLFDYRDREADRNASIRSLVTELNEKGIDTVFWGAMAACMVSAAWLWEPFPPLVLAALHLPVLLLCGLYRYAKRHHGDYLYYFVLDGLMMLSAPMVILAKFAR